MRTWQDKGRSTCAWVPLHVTEREQIETMEAIRMAQREEVEASKGAAAAASGRKVDAADVVPFVSKLR